MCVFVTQSPSDVLKQDIGKSVVESCVTQAYLANPRASRSDYVDGFKVEPEEFDIIKNLPEAGRTLLVKQGARSVLVKLDLEGFRDELVVLSGSIDNVELLDSIRAEVGDDPDAWMPILLRKVAERRALAKAQKATSHPITNPTAAAVNP
jgi:type IV secretion system protein VirB4